jgi:hypothetical protein
MGSGPERAGTVGAAPGGTAPGRAAPGPVVLLEAPEGAEAAELWRILEGGGARVSWCPGPDGPPAAWCPLMGGCRCSLVEAADVVVCALGLEQAPGRRVLQELGRLHPETAVVTEAPAPGAARWESVLEGHTVLASLLDGEALLEAVDAASGDRPLRTATR